VKVPNIALEIDILWRLIYKVLYFMRKTGSSKEAVTSHLTLFDKIQSRFCF